MSEAMTYKLPPLPVPDVCVRNDFTGEEVYSHSAEQMQAYAIAAIEAQGVPDGWQLVPTQRLVNARNLVDRGFWVEGAKVLDELIASAPPAPQAKQPMTDAARDVLAERQRQISVEGWTASNDDIEHDDGSLASAAACYALHTEPVGNVGDYLRFWPWASKWWKPSGRRRNLVKAGALILAEIERIDRAEAAHGIKGE